MFGVFLSLAFFTSYEVHDLIKDLSASNPFDKGPKVWTNYVEAFLFHQFETYQHKQMFIFTQLIQNLPLFHMLSVNKECCSKEIERLCLCKLCRRQGCLKDKGIVLRSPVGYFVLTEYLGKIQPHYVSSFDDYQLKFKENYERSMHGITRLHNMNLEDYLKRKPKLFVFAWNLLLNQTLSVKFVFTLINIRYGYHGACSDFHKFQVMSNSETTGNQTMFEYCGLFAPFALFPPGKTIHLQLICHQAADVSPHNDGSNMCWVLNELEALFTVIDKGLVVSQSIKVYPTRVQEMESIVLAQTNFLVSYLIQVNKRYRIVLKPGSSQHCVQRAFDGPGSSHNILQLEPHQHKTKTFQAFISVICSNDKESQVKSQIHFKSDEIIPSHSFIQHREDWTLPDLCTPDTFGSSVVHLTAPDKFKVKVTVKSVRFTGQYSSKCVFGGISFLEENDIQIKSLCKSTSENSTLGQNIYSSAQQLYLVVFWYSVLGNITGNLSVEKTNCNNKHIDPCPINIFCSPNSKALHLCHQYLSNVSSDKATFKKMMNTKSLLGHIFGASKEIKNDVQVSYTLHTNTCFVIQVWPDPVNILNLRGDCFFSLWNKLLLDFAADVHHHVKVNIPIPPYETGYVYFPKYYVSAEKLSVVTPTICTNLAFMTRGTNCYFVTTEAIYAGQSSRFVLEMGMPPHYTSSWTDLKVVFDKRSHDMKNFPFDTKRVLLQSTEIFLASLLLPHNTNVTGDTHILFFINITSERRVEHAYKVKFEGKGVTMTLSIVHQILCFCSAFGEVNEVAFFVPFKSMMVAPFVPHSTLYLRPVNATFQSSHSLGCKMNYSEFHSYSCENYSSIAFQGRRLHKKYFKLHNRIQKVSWEDASKMCEKLKAKLPMFHDPADLEELTPVIKVVRTFPFGGIYCSLTTGDNV